MITKLRNKFILINMILISIVLVIIFSAVYMSTRQRLSVESMDALQRALRDDKKMEFRPDDLRGPGPNQGFMALPTFTVRLDEDNKVISANGQLFDLSDAEALQQTVDLCLVSQENTGVIEDADLRFLKQDTPEGMKIAFVDRSQEISTLNSLVRTSLLVGLGSLLVFFMISLYLGKWALRPVKKAWQQQRQFVADASHELKTPLTVILANAEIVLSHGEATVRQQSKWLEYIQAEARRMSSLVDSMLFLAKADEGKNQVIFSRLNLSDTVWGAVLPFEPVIFEQNKTLDSEIEPDLYINGDELKIKQLIGILLDNACKYSNDLGRIQVRLYRQGEKIKLTVSNTGEVIPAEQLNSIFERFFRVDKSRAREQGGYGLGLAIAQSIAEMHNASISVHSTPEAGTTFTITFAACSPPAIDCSTNE